MKYTYIPRKFYSTDQITKYNTVGVRGMRCGEGTFIWTFSRET